MKFLDLFAGIGGFRLGMESAGHECVGFCEIDKFARASYKAIHNTEGEIELHDATGITKKEIKAIGQVDVICAGFPCQPFSAAGARRGFEDTNGTLFFEIARFASILKPKYLFLENVKGLISHDKGYTFETIIGSLDELGYDVEWQVLNSKDFGVPQNRERVFIIGHLRGTSGRQIFPIAETRSDKSIMQLGNIKKTESFGGNPQCGRIYSIDGLAPCLNTMQGGQREPKILIDGKVRKLTPRECWRLQGFPDWAFDKAQEVNSNSQLYKQAGNSVTVNVIKEIARYL
ncbi:MAG: DNA cytosine methyltransferase [Streptococcus thermophilus]|uniref:Cytosine-specific methyltransferase n=6 Tax=Aliceevansviridae TaxID=3044455 RepID=A0A7R6NGY4_9CAUD|nr:DNA-cytosine methyltransferase [Streptococcus phage CHPC1148]YP_010646669.1 DNA methyltransferase [Streptococcus phage P0091]YP_010682034.1 DNA methyltransferase [Streptococcus phage P0093]YP_010682125.1 DNA methyltransferase [Streptococcus phage P0092]YP_010682175.1 DNA-cytosine methyltransferase [Streptococcus phage CHPC1151]YP_010682219.1 DNA-cytosine methyltransferase [Streptococcus phage CHPC1282]ARU13145.1 DNA methyltransferase [Streptococcus phage P0094]AXF53561.1 DNA cytosine meth